MADAVVGTGSDPVLETDGSGNLTNEYVSFGGKRIARRDSSSNVFYYFADHLGTSRIIVEDGSTPTICYDADLYPFGGERIALNGMGYPIDSCDSRYKFTGKERDSESGLDNFGARYMSSQYGRFMTPDPINLTNDRLMSPSTTLNKYVYAADNPLKYVDPDGKDITIFYSAPSCTFCTDFGHIFIAALNQDTGQVGVLDYGPLNPRTGNGPGAFNLGDSAADAARYASLTIQTTPEEAQKVLDFITALTTQPAADYHWLSHNCTTVCQDALHDLGLDLHDISPRAFWRAVYRRYSMNALKHPIMNSVRGHLGLPVPDQPGVDYGNPRDYGMNFDDLLFQLYQNQQQPQPPVTVCTDDGLGNRQCTTE